MFYHFGLYSLHLELSVQGKKGIWIKLPIGLVHLVETAVKVVYANNIPLHSPKL